ncbi:hypothetical protein B0H17DRAFT_1138188 [Mycena rosella]|uniref:BTB domain-containing protein n=1 Tax=Mycena rosella TaxID=1033263 RepID=A0AAD7D6S3_MYCRO|nr:hypothetical protein B0H17DRAFT_1138188 [Mycena rosella]
MDEGVSVAGSTNRYNMVVGGWIQQQKTDPVSIQTGKQQIEELSFCVWIHEPIQRVRWSVAGSSNRRQAKCPLLDPEPDRGGSFCGWIHEPMHMGGRLLDPATEGRPAVCLWIQRQRGSTPFCQRAIFDLGQESLLPVPDGNLVLQPVYRLYDHSQPLFSTALSLGTSEQNLFLHPSFRDLHLQLGSKGLMFDVNWDLFVRCANCVQNVLAAGRLSEPGVMQSVMVVFDFYNRSLSSNPAASPRRWAQLNDIPFIPHNQDRSPSLSFDTDSYCVGLPAVVSPSQLIRQNYEQVAWSQRALFQEEPLLILAAINPSLGVPNAHEVVNCLAVWPCESRPNIPEIGCFCYTSGRHTAGSIRMIERAVAFKPVAKPQDSHQFREAFNAMRLRGQLTDIRLVPTAITPEELVVMDNIRGHSTVLAAAIPHVREALVNWNEGNVTEYQFPGTYFGAWAILDFIYTGKIERSFETDDEAANLMRNLLELLQVANQWDLPELKDEIGTVINEKGFLSQDTYTIIAPPNGERRRSSSIAKDGQKRTQDRFRQLSVKSVNISDGRIYLVVHEQNKERYKGGDTK